MKLIIEIDDIKYQNIVNAYPENNEIYAAIKNGTPIPDNATVCDRMKAERMSQAEFEQYAKEHGYIISTTNIIEQIRAEIDGLYEGMTNYYDNRPWMLKDKVLEIIDKYTKGAEK